MPHTYLYTLSLHDALPIFSCLKGNRHETNGHGDAHITRKHGKRSKKRETAESRWENLLQTEFEVYHAFERSEEHTSELQSRLHLVCRLLLEKKKKQQLKSI